MYTGVEGGHRSGQATSEPTGPVLLVGAAVPVIGAPQIGWAVLGLIWPASREHPGAQPDRTREHDDGQDRRQEQSEVHSRENSYAEHRGADES